MELEELRQVWNSIDERFENLKSLKDPIIKEIIYKKSNRSLNFLINYSFFGLIVYLILIPFCAWAYTSFGRKILFWDIAVIIAGFFCLVSAIFGVIQLRKLNQIDMLKRIKDNIQLIDSYLINIKRYMKFLSFIIGPVFVVLLVGTAVVGHAPPWKWMVIVCGVLIGILTSYWEYKRFLLKNVETIRLSLNELQALEE